MNNLAYSSQDKETVGAKVEELLRKEVVAMAPLVYAVEDEGAGETGALTMLKDARNAFFCGAATPVFTLRFQIPQPRATGLEVHLNRRGVGCYAGTLVYTAVLEKSFAGEILLDDHGKFQGDPGASGKLNTRKDLLKKCSAFAVTKGGLAGFEMTVPRLLRITPRDESAEIVVVTLPRSKSMGFSASFGSKQFFELASDIEAAM
jgi:hypothetical protein